MEHLALHTLWGPSTILCCAVGGSLSKACPGFPQGYKLGKDQLGTDWAQRPPSLDTQETYCHRGQLEILTGLCTKGVPEQRVRVSASTKFSMTQVIQTVPAYRPV